MQVNGLRTRYGLNTSKTYLNIYSSQFLLQFLIKTILGTQLKRSLFCVNIVKYNKFVYIWQLEKYRFNDVRKDKW